jgi:mono/diheme cytochrome c family protein
VNGKEWGSAVGMLAFKDALSDEQIAHVITFIRQAPEWKNNAPTVTAEMVKSVREKTSSRGAQWTSDELMKVPTAVE